MDGPRRAPFGTGSYALQKWTEIFCDQSDQKIFNHFELPMVTDLFLDLLKTFNRK